MSTRRRKAARRAAPAEQESLFTALGDEVLRVLKGLGADDARGHFRAARVEVLKGVRSLIDHRIDTLSKRPRRGTAIEVD